MVLTLRRHLAYLYGEKRPFFNLRIKAAKTLFWLVKLRFILRVIMNLWMVFKSKYNVLSKHPDL